MATAWRLLLSEHPDISLATGCTRDELIQAEGLIGQMPPDLAGFLLEVNGVFDTYGYQFGWPLSRIVVERQGEHYGPDRLGHLLAFGDNGTGEPFCVPTQTAEAATCPVYHWESIFGEATLLAPALRDFWTGWLSGSIAT